MKCTDLMIGDWVYCEGQPTPENVTIQTIAEDGVWFNGSNYEGAASYDRIFPIPITPEILEKNGFKNGELNVSPQYFLEDGHIFIGVTLKATPDRQEGVTLCKNINSLQYEGKIEFVHELQHALRLCGIDKEIVL